MLAFNRRVSRCMDNFCQESTSKLVYTLFFDNSMLPDDTARAAVQSCRYAANCLALVTQIPNLSQRGLFGGVRFQMPAVWTQPEAELDVANALSVATLVPQGIAGPLADRLALPLADGAHDGDDKAPAARAGVEDLGHGDQSHLTLLEQFEKTAGLSRYGSAARS
jgi:hypothetical protein